MNQIYSEISNITSSTNEVSNDMHNLNTIFQNQNKLVEDTGRAFGNIATAAEALGEECIKVMDAVGKMQESRNVIVDSVSNVGAISEEVTANAQDTENMNKTNLDTIQVLNQNVMELVEMIKRLNQQ